MRWARRAARAERGAVLVEFVIVIPIFLAVVIGAFSGGAAYYSKVAIVEAVREGARYGTSLPLPGGIGGVTAWEEAVRARVVEASTGELESNDVCVILVLPVGGTQCGIADPPGASAEPSVHLVKVSASRNTELQFLLFDVDVELSSRLAARYERDTG